MPTTSQTLEYNSEKNAGDKQMNASLAASQGVLPNLLRLMDLHNRKWHPRAGALALRLGDSLVPKLRKDTSPNQGSRVLLFLPDLAKILNLLI